MLAEAAARIAGAARAVDTVGRIGGEEFAWLLPDDWDPGRQARLHQAARLHDLGKAALPDNLLSRLGPLSGPELEHVRQHARIGAGLAAGVLDDEQASWVRHHHERWDGAGYPGALEGDAIPDGAQLLALADVWDTMTNGRPYRAHARQRAGRDRSLRRRASAPGRIDADPQRPRLALPSVLSG